MDTARIALERYIDSMQAQPETAQGTVHAVARVGDGMTCVVTEGDRELVSDIPETLGGGGRGPSPGVYGRAAITSCIAISIKMWAARRSLAVTSIEVALDADYDGRGDFGVDKVPAGFQEIRLRIAIAGDCDREALADIVAAALRTSTWTDAMRRAQLVRAAISVNGVSVA
jgi:uncharacterized OsmC-like protein